MIASRTSILVALPLALLFLACPFALFDFAVEWRNGPYGLVVVDDPENTTLAYHTEGDTWATLVEPRVFAVGANQRYIVVKQHPDGKKSTTNYFIVDIAMGMPKGNQRGGVAGPLTEQEFNERVATMQLPPFTKTLE